MLEKFTQDPENGQIAPSPAYLDTIKTDLIKDNFAELSKVEFLPTGQRETRYLLGIESNNDRNPVEQFLEMAVGKIEKRNLHNYNRERRTTGGTVDKNFYTSADDTQTGALDEIRKNFNQGDSSLVLKAKNFTGADKPNLNYVSLIFLPILIDSAIRN